MLYRSDASSHHIRVLKMAFDTPAPEDYWYYVNHGDSVNCTSYGENSSPMEKETKDCSDKAPEPPDLSVIRSTVVRSVIYNAWKAKHGCEKETPKSHHSADLSEALHTAKADCVLEDVLKEAVKYKVHVLREVVCKAVEEDIFEDIFTEANKCGLLSSLVLNCRRFNVSLVKVAITCGLLGDVLREAVQGGVLTKVIDGALRSGAVTALTILTEAIPEECRVVEEVLDGATRRGMLTEVLTEAFIRDRMCDVLRKAVECGVGGKVLDGAMNMKAGLLIDVLREVRECGLLPKALTTSDSVTVSSLVKEMIIQFQTITPTNQHLRLILSGSLVDCSLLLKALYPEVDSIVSDVLLIAVESHGWGILLPCALKIGTLGGVLQWALWSGKLDTFVEEAERFQMLNEVLLIAGEAGTDVLEALLDCEQNAKRAYTGLGMELRKAWMMGKLRKTLKSLHNSHFILPITEVSDIPIRIEASFYGILDEVLEAERLNNLFDAIITCILLLCITASVKSRNPSQGTNAHRKCVIDHVTIGSGDIEKNPGPVFLNDWLKEMFALSVRVVYGCQGKRIPWKKLGLPDPFNSRLDRSEILKLFHGNLLKDAEIRIPVTHAEEFQTLEAYLRNGQEPDLCRLGQLVETHKLRITLQDSLKKLQTLPPSVQQDVTDFLNQEQLQFTLVDTKEPPCGARKTARDEDGIHDPVAEAGGEQEDCLQAQEQSGEADKEEQGKASVDEQDLVQDNDCSIEDEKIYHHLDSTKEQDVILAGLSGGQTPLQDADSLEDILFQLLEKEGLPDVDEDQKQQDVMTAGQACGSEDTEDPLVMLLDQHVSGVSGDATDNMMQPEKGNGLNTVCAQDLALGEDGSDPCQDHIHTTSQQEQSVLLDPLQERVDILVSNLKLLTGFPNLDKNVYKPGDTGISSRMNSLCRKRPCDISQMSESDTATKQVKFQ